MTVAMAQRNVASIGALKRQFDQRSGNKFVRYDKLGDCRRACASFNDAPNRLIGRQLHDHVEFGGIDAASAQRILKDLSGAGTFFTQHPGCSAQVVELDGLHGSELVRLGDHHNELIDGHGDLGQERLINIALDKAEIGGSVEHGAGSLLSVANVQLDNHPRVRRVELIEYRRQPITRNGLTGPQAQPTAQQAIEVGKRLFGLCDIGENDLCLRQKNCSSLGQLEAPANTAEQCCPEPRLKRLDGCACSGLGHVEDCGCSRDMKPLGDLYKDPKLFESHDRRPECWRLLRRLSRGQRRQQSMILKRDYSLFPPLRVASERNLTKV
jgi:hypothetical protein